MVYKLNGMSIPLQFGRSPDNQVVLGGHGNAGNFLFKYRYLGGTAVQNLLGVSRLVLLEGEIACASISKMRILYH